MSLRRPVVSGYFYEDKKEALVKRVEWSYMHGLGPGALPRTSEVRVKESLGFIAPHAGYIYSGPVAAHSYARIAAEGKPEVFVILGPNHTGLGEAVSVWDEGPWETPLGRVEVDTGLARNILKNSRYARPDKLAHYEEHSIEVQLPFLQHLFKDVKIVPITVMYQVSEVAKDLAIAISKSVAEMNRDVVIISTTDLSHYEPYENAVEKDRLVLDKIKALDPEGLFEVVTRRNISMCGVAPVMTLLYYANLNKSSGAEILKYATSGDTSGDKSFVVGYAAARIIK